MLLSSQRTAPRAPRDKAIGTSKAQRNFFGTDTLFWYDATKEASCIVPSYVHMRKLAGTSNTTDAVIEVPATMVRKRRCPEILMFRKITNAQKTAKPTGYIVDEEIAVLGQLWTPGNSEGLLHQFEDSCYGM